MASAVRHTPSMFRTPSNTRPTWSLGERAFTPNELPHLLLALFRGLLRGLLRCLLGCLFLRGHENSPSFYRRTHLFTPGGTNPRRQAVASRAFLPARTRSGSPPNGHDRPILRPFTVDGSRVARETLVRNPTSMRCGVLSPEPPKPIWRIVLDPRTSRLFGSPVTVLPLLNMHRHTVVLLRAHGRFAAPFSPLRTYARLRM